MMTQNLNANLAPRKQPTRNKKPLTFMQKVYRNRLLIGFAVFFLAVAIIAIIFTVFIMDRINDNKIHDYGRVKAYASYTVQYGDTLWSIAEDMAETMPEYPNTKTYLRDLKSSNNIYGDKIYEGDVIQIPYFKMSETNQLVIGHYGLNTAQTATQVVEIMD